MHGKTMREALNEVRSFRDVATEGGPGSGPQKGGKKQTSANIKKAYGILNDPRYKQGNYSGAAKAIDKLSPGLSNHPDVKNAMKRANETLDLPATGDTTTSSASQENEIVEKESINEFKLKDSDIEKLKKGVKQGKPIKVFKLNKPVKAGYGEELEEAKFTPAQISKLQTTYGKLGPGYEKNAIRMNQLAKMMRKYSKDHLSQLANLDIPMVSKVAKELMKEETFNENWQYEMEIEYGDSMDDDQETIVVFGNVRGATLESQADRKYDQLEKQMQKKYGRDAMIDGGTMRGKTNDRSRGGSNPIERKDI